MDDSDQKFSKSKYFHSFSGNHFSPRFMLPCSYFSVFSKSATTPQYTIFDTRLPPCNAISEGSRLLNNTSSEAGVLPLEVRIENDSDRKLSKSKNFNIIFGNHYSPHFMLPCSLLPHAVGPAAHEVRGAIVPIGDDRQEFCP